MKRLRRVRPTPAMVVAALALLVALGGTSVAAVSIVIPRASIGALQLKPNSVNSSKVQNFSLRRADFLPGVIPVARRGATGPAGPPGPAGPTGPAGAAGPAGPAGASASGSVAEVLSQTNTSGGVTTSTSYTNINGANLSVNVPSNETDKLVVYFSGESACYGGNALARCLLKITVDGTELSPAAGSDAAFDNNDRGEKKDGTFDAKNSGDKSQHAIFRVSGNLSAGAHPVQVQISTTNTNTAFQVEDWALVVERIKTG
jgi:hypothetical protein